MTHEKPRPTGFHCNRCLFRSMLLWWRRKLNPVTHLENRQSGLSQQDSGFDILKIAHDDIFKVCVCVCHTAAFSNLHKRTEWDQFITSRTRKMLLMWHEFSGLQFSDIPLHYKFPSDSLLWKCLLIVPNHLKNLVWFMRTATGKKTLFQALFLITVLSGDVDPTEFASHGKCCKPYSGKQCTQHYTLGYLE